MMLLAFVEMAVAPEKLSKIAIRILERFVILMYSRTSNADDVNECRYELFV